MSRDNNSVIDDDTINFTATESSEEQQQTSDNTIMFDNEIIDNNETMIEQPSEENEAGEDEMENNEKFIYKRTVMQNVRRFLKWLFLILLGLGIILGLMMLAAFFYVYSSVAQEVDDANFWINKTSVSIYDINDEFITSLTPNYVSWVGIKDENGDQQISQDYLDGVVDTENNKFYTQGGIGVGGMLKAVFWTTFTPSDRGGSTITMQLGKLLYMPEWYVPDANGIIKSSEKPFTYKFLQMSYAIQINQKYSKTEILENYVNTVYFGAGGYGITNASMYYYGKEPADLTLAESAMLAGIPQQPGSFNPYDYPEATLARRNDVLDAMLAEEDITQEEYDEAINTPISAGLVDQSDTPEDETYMYTGYLDAVYRELGTTFADDETDFDYTNAGMKVYTYLDPSLQKSMYEIQNSSDYVSWQDDYVQSGAITIDSQDGAIYAIGNGRNQDSIGGTNYALNYQRQPGSTSKPIVDYGPAIEYLNWSTWHVLQDEPMTFSDNKSEINNADGTYRGPMSMQTAVDKSRNPPAVQTFQAVSEEVGTEKIQSFMSGLGISDTGTLDSNGENPVLYEPYSIGGWTQGTTPYEMAGAFAAFANGGTYNQPHTIRYVSIDPVSPYYDEYGATYEQQYESHQAMQPSTAFMMTQMLDANNEEAQGYGTYTAGSTAESIPDQSLKTGTTNWGSEGHDNHPELTGQLRDKWVVGYTPDVTTAVWLGYTGEYEKLGYIIDDELGNINSEYQAIMQAAYDDDQPELHDGKVQEQPSNVETRTLVPNQDPPVLTSSGTTYYFIKDSKDLEYVDGVGTASNAKPSEPSVSYAINGTDITFKWSYTGSDVSNATWNVYIDDKVYKNVSDPTITISDEDMADFAGCKTDYDVGISLVQKDSNDKKQESSYTNNTVTWPNKDFCQKQ